MTIINPKSISGITSITTASGADNLLTVHTNNTTERVRINNDGDVIVGSGITVSPDGDIFATGVTTSTTFVGAVTGNVTGNATGLSGTPNISAGTISGSTGTFSGDVDIADKIVHTGDTDTAIRFSGADTITAETGGSSRFKIDSSGNVTIGNDGDSGSNPSSGYDELCIEGGNEAIGMCFLSPAANDVEQTIAFGDSNNNQSGKIQYEHANDAMHFDTGGSERLRIDSSGRVGINCTPQEILHVKAASEAINTRDGVIFGSTDSLAADKGLPLVWAANIGTDADYGVASICGRKENSTSDNGAGYLQFGTGTGPGAIEERMRIDSDGKLLHGCTSTNGGTSEGNLTIEFPGNTRNAIKTRDTDNSGTVIHMVFVSGSSAVGTISGTTGQAFYNNLSDYRSKENDVKITDGIEKIKLLRPIRFNYKVDKDTLCDGFFAHEVAAAVPTAVQGEKDAVDSDGKIDPQMLDTGKIIPLLTAALQEAVTKIEVLETRLNNAGIAT